MDKSIVTPSQPYRGWDSDDANSGDSSQVIRDGDSDKPQAPKKWPCPQCGEIVEKFYATKARALRLILSPLKTSKTVCSRGRGKSPDSRPQSSLV